jgi:signal transduction histidine kinase
MKKGEIIEQLNIVKQCKKYNLPLWQCPQFVFVMMGAVIILSALLTYALGFRYVDDPLMIALIVLLTSWVLLILAYFVTSSVQKLADAARMKLEFLTIMTHQIRAPFANLKWVVDLLISNKVGKIEEDQREYLDILRENSERLEELINKIVTVSKIEQGKLPLNKKDFSLEELTKKVIKESKAYAKATNVELKMSSPEKLPMVYADESQIREVVENLINNAIKYSNKKGDVVVNIEKKKEKEIYFEVKDSGVGIPKEDQKYIFSKFFRSGNAIKHQTQGSGLGLYIIKSIIKAHKGKVGFISKEGAGSTFWFTLPLKIKKDKSN